MNDLADGFARHLVSWARTLQAPADSLAVPVVTLEPNEKPKI